MFESLLFVGFIAVVFFVYTLGTFDLLFKALYYISLAIAILWIIYSVFKFYNKISSKIARFRRK